MQVLYDAGFGVVDSDTPNEWSYSFSGLSGSLDHVLANAGALDMVTGADIWESNSNESPAYQYSRFNYNATNLFAGTPYAASDHNPEVVGLNNDARPLRGELGVKVVYLGSDGAEGLRERVTIKVVKG
jgi:5'-nucleotidase